jgi:hypothetical protein
MPSRLQGARPAAVALELEEMRELSTPTQRVKLFLTEWYFLYSKALLMPGSVDAKPSEVLGMMI